MNKKNPTPLVSIIIPVFNGSDYLSEAIDSALAQTYQNLEVVVVNDGSNDQGETEKIALGYGDKISYYKKENGGVATALNFGISKMKGDYFSWLSHDDLYFPDKIESQILEISRYDHKTILYSDYRVFTENPSDSLLERLKAIRHEDFRYWITVENRLHGCTLLIPKIAFEECGVFNPTLRTTQDYALWFHLAKKYKFIYVPQVTVFARSHANQGSLSIPSIVKQECDDLIKSFINELDPYEIMRATKKDLKSSYLEIAHACQIRGFENAAIRANELAGAKQPLYIVRSLHKMKAAIPQKAKFFLKNIANFLSYKKQSVQAENKNSLRKDTNIHPIDTNLQDKFTQIYRENTFGGKESRSGEGSNLIQSAIIRQEIPKIVKAYNISTFLDAPCGDWHWMRTVDLGVQKYTGVDIVPELIEKNNKEFGSSIVSFRNVNLVTDKLPQADLIFSRDCLVHLSFSDAHKIIANFKRSGAKYLLTTTFTDRDKNSDLIDEQGNELFWRPLNMQLPPFNFPPPLEVINEGCTEGDNLFTDKSLGLWLLEDIKYFGTHSLES